MRRLAWIAGWGMVFGMPFSAWGAGVVINEIAWMGSLPVSGETSSQASNNEWIELYNSSSGPITLDEWSLVAADGTPMIALAGTIPARGFFLLERTGDETVPSVAADLIYVGALSNGGEHLRLLNKQGVVADEVNAVAGWPAGDNTTKDTMQRSGSSWITAPATPKAGVSVPTPAPSPSPEPQSGTGPSTPSGSSSAKQTFTPVVTSLTVDAGEDVITAVGSIIEFRGAALGINHEPIPYARYWWNFGDGADTEGRNVTHIYAIPGTYIAGLHVSSGEHAGSAYITVSIGPNKLEITGVVPGSSGYIQLTNPSDTMIDIGGWLVKDGREKTFVLPSKTKVAARSHIALSNNITGLLNEPGASPISLVYPNGSLATSTTATQPLPSPPPSVSGPTISPSAVVGQSGSLSADVGHAVLAAAGILQGSVETRGIRPPVKKIPSAGLTAGQNVLPTITPLFSSSPSGNPDVPERNKGVSEEGFVGNGWRDRGWMLPTFAIAAVAIGAVGFFALKRIS